MTDEGAAAGGGENTVGSGRKLLSLYVVAVVLVAGSGIGYTFAQVSDHQATEVSITAAGNFGTRTAGNTPTPGSGGALSSQEAEMTAQSTPTEAPTRAFSFAACCTDASDVTTADITVTPTVTTMAESTWATIQHRACVVLH